MKQSKKDESSEPEMYTSQNSKFYYSKMYSGCQIIVKIFILNFFF